VKAARATIVLAGDRFGTYNGQQFLSIRCPEAMRMMDAKSKELMLSMNCPENLETIFTEIADNPNPQRNFEKFFKARDERLEREKLAAQQVATDVQPEPPIGNPSQNLGKTTMRSASRQPLVNRPLTAAQQQIAAKKLK
jgi:hypothetical protein